MPDRISTSPDLRRSGLRTLALGAALSTTVIAATSSHRFPDAVTVDHVPPDACLAFYGPGPCREHGLTILGSTDAVAGPPPDSWHGKVGTRVRARS